MNQMINHFLKFHVLEGTEPYRDKRYAVFLLERDIVRKPNFHLSSNWHVQYFSV